MLQYRKGGFLKLQLGRLRRPGPLGWTALAVLFGGALLRVLACLHDLPYSFYPDELHFLNRSVGFGSGDLNPHWFHKPAFFMYVLFGVTGLYFLAGRAVGAFHSVHDFAVRYFVDKGPFLLLGRLTTTLFGTVGLYVAYLAGRATGGARAGLFALLFLAVCAGNVLGSMQIKADVPAATFAILSAYFLVRAVRGGGLRFWAAAGAAAGLGTATKYSPIALVPVFFLCAWMSPRRDGESLLRKVVAPAALLATGATLLFFFLGSPYNFLDPAARAFFLGQATATGGGAAWSLGRWVEAMRQQIGVISGLRAAGLPTVLLAAAGAIVLFRRDRRSCAIWAGYPLIFFVASTYKFSHSLVEPVAHPRHFNPIYPFLAVLAGVGLDTVVSKTTSILAGGPRALRRALAALLVVCAAGFPAYASLRLVWRETRPDTRVLARDWMIRNLPAGSHVLIDENGPPFARSAEFVRHDLEVAQRGTARGFSPLLRDYYRYKLEAARRDRSPLVVEHIEHAWWLQAQPGSGAERLTSPHDADMGNPVRRRGVLSLDEYRKEGFRYVVTHDDIYPKYVHGPLARTFPIEHRFYSDLFRCRLVHAFRPGPDASGPVVSIYCIDP